jgi:hypothetical protein
MKKVLHLIIAAFISISAMGQPVDMETRIKEYQKQQGMENFHPF